MRDFSTISPSAKSVLLMKGHTTIPFAREVAERISSPEAFLPDLANADLLFWSKVFHFESRYLQINQLLEGIDVESYLELSSGFNFRCLEISEWTRKVYVDTDLPELIEEKLRVFRSLRPDATGSKVKMKALNALDALEFSRTVSEMPPGPIAIINEGLLVYLGESEKRQLCQNVRDSLLARGGYWITSDIYVRATPQRSVITQDPNTKAFSERHNIEENKFSSFDEAKEFFETNGFLVDAEDNIDASRVSSFPYLANLMPEASNLEARSSEKRLQKTWRLRVAKC
jgi:O-methyltransferase involved in polyketide biosynthesis